jgi:hypothetical protein
MFVWFAVHRLIQIFVVVDVVIIVMHYRQSVEMVCGGAFLGCESDLTPP